MFIMDAMRFDVFQELIEENKVDGSLLKVYSAGCETGMWMRNTFTDPEYKDIVLVSNSVIYWRATNRHLLPKFYKTNPLWKGWRKLNATTYVDAIILSTEGVLLEAQKDAVINKDRKLLIHDISPHLPFCDEVGRKFLDSLAPKPLHPKYIMKYCGQNPMKWVEVREYYKRSAWISLKAILDCKWIHKRGGLVITTDHGEMIGENYKYGHSQAYGEHPILRHVPWFEPI